MPNRNNLFYDAVNTVAHSHINCACNNAYRNIYPQFCGTSRRRPLLSLFFPPLQICYDTTHTFFVGAIIGRPLIRILLTTPQSFHDSSPQAKSLSLRRGGTQWRSGGYRDIEASYSLYTGGR